MSGTADVCRTCLRADHLERIFARDEYCERYTVALFLATGLQIELQDGLPQTMCSECITFINAAIQFRNQSHKSEQTLLKWGRRMKTKSYKTHYRLSHSEMHEVKQEFSNDYKSLDVCSKTDTSDLNELRDFPESILNLNDTSDFQNGIIESFTSKEHHSYNIEVSLDTKDTKLKDDKKKRYEQLVDGPTGGPGPYVCKVCKKILKSWSSFRTHAKIHLGFDFMCEFCGKTFIAVTMLRRHCMSRHGAERTYLCSLCDYRALDSERLKIHERREHTGERPYVCDVCQASFLTRRNFVHHLAVHATRRTVQCPRCPAKFKSSQHLACHTSKVHRRRWWRLACYLCDNTYTKCDNLRKHLAKLHGVPRPQQGPLRRVRVAPHT